MRYYSTDLRDAASLLGPGWRTDYSSTLGVDLEGYVYTTPQGSEVVFDDPAGSVDQGGVLVDHGTFHELFRRGEEYVVSQWDVEAITVTRAVFRRSGNRDEWRLHAIEDVTGQGVTVSYDPLGRIDAVTESRGRRALKVVYGPLGLAQEVWLVVEDYSRRLVRYEYDSRGRLVAAHDAADEAARYEYDDENRLVRELTRDGGDYRFRYDDRGRCTDTSGTDGYDAQSIEYDPATLRTTVTDSTGQRWMYQLRDDGQVASITSPLGFVKGFEYDEYGRETALIEENGATVRYAYDDAGNRSAITNPLGFRDEFTFDEARRPVLHQDRAGGQHRFTYDARHRLSGAVTPAGEEYRYEYNQDGDHVAIIDPLGAVRSFEHNAYGDTVRWTSYEGQATALVRDREGRIVRQEDPMGNRWEIEYDLRGNPSRITLPGGGVHHLWHDADGRLRTHVDPLGRRSTVEYASGGRALREEFPDGSVVQYRWSTVPDRLEEVVNELGESYRFEFDPDGRLAREIAYDGREMRFEYDPAGWCTAIVEPSGRETRFFRDLAGQLVRKLLPDGKEVSFVYDPLGEVIEGVNDVCTVVFTRDWAGRIVREQIGDHWVESDYDARGQRVARRSGLGVEERYGFDAEGNLARIGLGGGHEISATRDEVGNPVEWLLDSRVALRQRFDADSRTTSQWLGRIGRAGLATTGLRVEEVLIDRQFRYDPAGSLDEVVDSKRGRTRFLYTPREWIAGVDRSAGPGERYRLDAAGNLLTAAYGAADSSSAGENGTLDRFHYAAGGQPLARNDTTYEYDADGRTTRKVEGSGAATPSTWTYGWNSAGLLESVERPDGQLWRYDYDPFGRRIRKAGEEGTEYVWDQCVPIHEVRADSVVTLVFEPESFRPLLWTVDGTPHLCVTDTAGRPRELVSPQGNLSWEADFTAWGLRIGNARDGTPGLECALRFQGQWYDAESGLCYNWFRYFDPERSGYTSRDPSGITGDIHPYTYPRNPLLWIDPSGLVPLNEPGYAVYALFRPGATEPYYIGITNDVSRRQQEHRDSGRLRGRNRMEVLHDNVRYSVARGYEQAYIEHHRTKRGFPSNEINSFRHARRDRRAQAFKRAYSERMAALRRRRGCRR